MARSTYTQPLPLPAAGWRRRLEVFSPKLARRLSLGSYDAWRCWIALEANPAVKSSKAATSDFLLSTSTAAPQVRPA